MDFNKIKQKISTDIGLVNEEEKTDNRLLTNDLMQKTDCISSKVYETIPDLFKDIVNESIHQNNNRKKDIMLLSSLSTISSLFNSVSFIYHKKQYKLNLYYFLVGKAGQGKSLMRTGFEILKVQIDANKLNNEQIMKEYKNELYRWETSDKKERGQKPDEPKLKHLYIGGNISSSEFINRLKNGTGLLYDTEADTLANTMTQDWGNYTTTLRKAFEHESDVKVRVGADDVYLENPSLSVCISGTLNQAFKLLISNVENGLFSRFMSYIYSDDSKRISGRPVKNDNGYKTTVDYFANIVSPKIQEKILEINNREIDITFSESQWDKLDKFLDDSDIYLKYKTDKDVEALVNRYGTILLRIASIFTIFRKKIDIFNTECDDIDFNNAINIVKVLMNHSLLLLDSSNDDQPTLQKSKKGDAINLIYTYLKKEFITQELHALMNKHNISTKTGERALQEMVKNGIVKKIKTGEYEWIGKK